MPFVTQNITSTPGGVVACSAAALGTRGLATAIAAIPHVPRATHTGTGSRTPGATSTPQKLAPL